MTVDAGNTASGDARADRLRKDVGIRADRADGFVLDNLKVRHAKEHDIYVIETDGSHLDRFKAPYAGEYGVLTFVADHSLIENCDAWGSRRFRPVPGRQRGPRRGRPAEPARLWHGDPPLRHAPQRLGYSGTDGNAVWIHDNKLYDNTMGFSTDVFTAPGHPGFPQDSDLLEHNDIYSNNFNAYLPHAAREAAWAQRAEPGLLGRRPEQSRCRSGRGCGSRAGTQTSSATTTSRQLAPRGDALPGARPVRLRRPEQPGGRL